MKRTFKILYVVLALFIFLYIEGQGGINHFRKNSFAQDYFLSESLIEKPNETLAYYSAASNIYFSNTPLLSMNNHSEQNDEKYQISVSVYPYLSLGEIKLDDTHTVSTDGFFIVLDERNENVDFYSVEVHAKNPQDAENKDIVLYKTKDGVPVMRIMNHRKDYFKQENINSTPVYITLISNAYLLEAESMLLDDDAKTDYSNRGIYDLTSMSIHAHIGDDTVEIFKSDLDIKSDQFLLSKNIDSDKGVTSEDIITYNLVNTYHGKDLFSAYNYWIFVIFGLYLVLLIIAPYFIFFHKRVLLRFKKKQETIVSPKTIKPNDTQIFIDEPEDDK